VAGVGVAQHREFVARRRQLTGLHGQARERQPGGQAPARTFPGLIQIAAGGLDVAATRGGPGRAQPGRQRPVTLGRLGEQPLGLVETRFRQRHQTQMQPPPGDAGPQARRHAPGRQQVIGLRQHECQHHQGKGRQKPAQQQHAQRHFHLQGVANDQYIAGITQQPVAGRTAGHQHHGNDQQPLLHASRSRWAITARSASSPAPISGNACFTGAARRLWSESLS
jgi:hypothetical protein